MINIEKKETPIRTIEAGKLKVRIIRVKKERDIEYRFTIASGFGADEGLCIGELQVVRDVIDEAIEEAQSYCDADLRNLSLFPWSWGG